MLLERHELMYEAETSVFGRESGCLGAQDGGKLGELLGPDQDMFERAQSRDVPWVGGQDFRQHRHGARKVAVLREDERHAELLARTQLGFAFQQGH